MAFLCLRHSVAESLDEKIPTAPFRNFRPARLALRRRLVSVSGFGRVVVPISTVIRRPMVESVYSVLVDGN